MLSLATSLTATWAAFSVFQYGLAIGGLNGISDALTCSMPNENAQIHSVDLESWLKPCVVMTPTQFGLVVSILTLGGLAGSLACDALTRSTGRIGTLRVSSAVILVGSNAVGLANQVSTMMIGRLLIGFGCGLATVSVPLILAELAPSNIRRSLGMLNQLFIVLGIFTSQSLSFPFAKPYTWRYVLVVSASLAAVQLLSSLFVPQLMRGEASDGREESEPLIGEVARKPLSLRELVISKDNQIRQGFLVVVVAMISQQICGISPVMYFSTKILQPVFNGNSRSVALLVVAVKIPLTIVPALIINRFGSRDILLFSSGLMSIAALCLAVGINMSVPALSAVAIVTFVMAFSVGLGPVVWIVISDVMPREATTAAGAIGVAINWGMAFVMGSGFLPLQHYLSGGQASGEGNIFFLFCALCLTAFIGIRYSYCLYDRVTI